MSGKNDKKLRQLAKEMLIRIGAVFVITSTNKSF